jgi:chemotaxis protein MotA
MLVLIGIVVVLTAVVGGFLMEQGNLLVLVQPSEALIILGAAAGILLVANSKASVLSLLKGTLSVFRRSPYTSAYYEAVLKMMYELFSIGRRLGMPSLEDHIEDPDASSVFQAYPEFEDLGARVFLCDSLRMVTSGIAQPGELAHLMDIDAEVQRRERHAPVNALNMLADSLPGLGIVAAALVGTFLGILLCYGIVGPLASRLESGNEARSHLFQCLYSGLHAFARGSSPLLAAEFARRSIPAELRPSFVSMTATFRREMKLPAVAGVQTSAISAKN